MNAFLHNENDEAILTLAGSCKHGLCNLIKLLTLILPPLNSSDIFNLASTTLFKSLWTRRPKSLNIVDPPDRTTFFAASRVE